MFVVGQKVVRIGGANVPGVSNPPFNTPLTVSWVGIYEGTEEEIIDLVECPSPANLPNWDRGYYSVYFRPVVDKKTDIAIFTKMLNPNNQRVDA